MKYRIIDVKTIRRPYIKGGSILGNYYDVTYEVDTWSWRKFKVTTNTKRAFKLPIGVAFRDVDTGLFVPDELDALIEAFIKLQEYDYTRSN